MSRVYRSSVKETTRKALLESPHPHRPYQAHAVAEEEAAHTAVAEEEAAHSAAAEEAAQVDTRVETEPDTPGDTHTPPDTDTPAEIQADTPAPDNAAHASIVSGPPSGMDPSVTLIPRNINPSKSRAPTLPQPRLAIRSCSACFSLRALLVGAGLPNLSLSVLSGSDISGQNAKNL